jgi:phosphate starvation-inducible PhoH-like protein
VLRSIDGIKFIHFDERDVVRHRLVQQIVRAYERYQQEKDGGSGEPTPREGRSRDGG